MAVLYLYEYGAFPSKVRMTYHQHCCLDIETDSAFQGRVLPSRPCRGDGRDVLVPVYAEG